MALNLTPASLAANAVSLANLLNSSLAVDVNAVLNQDTLQQVFPDARPMKALVKEVARVMDYPVETGAILSDHKVVLPNEITIAFFVPSKAYATAYQQIRNAWRLSTKLAVQTRTGTYLNMIIAEMPHEEDPETYTAINMAVKFREVQFVAPLSTARPAALANYRPANPENSITVNRGLITALTGAGAAYSYLNALRLWGL